MIKKVWTTLAPTNPRLFTLSIEHDDGLPVPLLFEIAKFPNKETKKERMVAMIRHFNRSDAEKLINVLQKQMESMED